MAAEVRTMEDKACLVHAAVRGAVEAGANRHTAASVTAAAIRTVLACDGDEASVEQRVGVLKASLLAHASLNDLNGAPSHNLGCATQRASAALSRGEKQALSSLRKKANHARHHWPGRADVDPEGIFSNAAADSDGVDAVAQSGGLLPNRGPRGALPMDGAEEKARPSTGDACVQADIGNARACDLAVQLQQMTKCLDQLRESCATQMASDTVIQPEATVQQSAHFAPQDHTSAVPAPGHIAAGLDGAAVLPKSFADDGGGVARSFPGSVHSNPARAGPTKPETGRRREIDLVCRMFKDCPFDYQRVLSVCAQRRFDSSSTLTVMEWLAERNSCSST